MNSKPSFPIVGCIDDIFFISKVRNAAKSLHIELRFVSGSVDDAVRNVASWHPSKIVIDLNSAQTDVIRLIRSLKSSPATSMVSIIGFLSHVDTELRDKAIEAGCDRVMPRSAFSDQLSEILSANPF